MENNILKEIKAIRTVHNKKMAPIIKMATESASGWRQHIIKPLSTVPGFDQEEFIKIGAIRHYQKDSNR